MLANYVNATTVGDAWLTNATSLKTKINEVFWADDLGMYRDNATTTLCPQDANSLAILFNLTTAEQANSISDGLTKNWNDLGPVAPELPDTISPFVSGFEVCFEKSQTYEKITQINWCILVASAFHVGER